MDSVVLHMALTDFDINKNLYNSLSKDEIKTVTNNIIDNHRSSTIKHQCLLLSQDILLKNKKKSVKFILKCDKGSDNISKIDNNVSNYDNISFYKNKKRFNKILLV